MDNIQNRRDPDNSYKYYYRVYCDHDNGVLIIIIIDEQRTPYRWAWPRDINHNASQEREEMNHNVNIVPIIFILIAVFKKGKLLLKMKDPSVDSY